MCAWMEMTQMPMQIFFVFLHLLEMQEVVLPYSLGWQEDQAPGWAWRPVLTHCSESSDVGTSPYHGLPPPMLQN